MKLTKTMHAGATPEQVISFLVDSSIAPPGTSMDIIYESPEMVGNSYQWTFKLLGIPRKGITVCTEYVLGERVAFRSFGAFEGSTSWTVEPEDGGSKATMTGEMTLPIPLIGRFFEPLVRKQWERNLAWGKEELEKLAKAERAPA